MIQSKFKGGEKVKIVLLGMICGMKHDEHTDKWYYDIDLGGENFVVENVPEYDMTSEGDVLLMEAESIGKVRGLSLETKKEFGIKEDK